ncbi:MAG: CCA tRNA nucleotidyltransferase [Anaerolineales bacterium]|nr:CCA tRNA nucleotidyltransferase [Anaerolineales bacterium]
MQKDLLRLMRNPSLLPSEKQDLLTHIANQSASMNMPCYIVGGFVRDLLLEKPVKDFDIVVEGDAIKLGEALVKKHGGKLTAHHKFSTAIWFVHENEFVDLITARSEVYEHAGALPTVKPSTIDDDIRRRDFSINAMAVRIDGDHFGELLDPLNGQNDLKEKTVRVLHPHSFIDDPTRIFRAIRYEQRYGFKIEPNALKMISQESFEILSKLSGERIRHEFDLIFAEVNSSKMIFRLGELGALGAFHHQLPELNEKYSELFNSKTPDEFGISNNQVMLGYLLWLLDSPMEMVRSISNRLDFSADLSDAVRAVLHLKNELPTFADFRPSTWTARLDKVPLISIYVLWLVTKEAALKEFLTKWRHVKTNITGDDLIARGIAPGPRYKEILTRLRAAWLDGEVKNQMEEKELLMLLL